MVSRAPLALLAVAALLLLGGGIWAFRVAAIPHRVELRLTLEAGEPYDIYLGRRHLGRGAVRIDDEDLRQHGVPVSWSPDWLATDNDLTRLLSEELGLLGERVGFVRGDLPWGVSLIGYERGHHPGLTAAVQLGEVHWLRPGGALDSFYVILVREHDAPVAYVGLVRARRGRRGTQVAGHSGSGNPTEARDTVVVDWEVIPGFHSFDLPYPPDKDPRRHEIPGAERWWIADFPEGQDLSAD